MSIIPIMWALAMARIEMARHDERGEITEKVIIIAVFAALAISIGAIVVAKVTNKAEAINLDG
jgi:hypothetical protein